MPMHVSWWELYIQTILDFHLPNSCTVIILDPSFKINRENFLPEYNRTKKSVSIKARFFFEIFLAEKALNKKA